MAHDRRTVRRPERTSAAFVDVESAWLSGGGGSWQYEPAGRGTDWTQTNTLELRPGWLFRLLAPLVERNLRIQHEARDGQGEADPRGCLRLCCGVRPGSG